jgi:hypothetical protein
MVFSFLAYLVLVSGDASSNLSWQSSTTNTDTSLASGGVVGDQCELFQFLLALHDQSHFVNSIDEG